jgi:hypothetical protein
VVATHVAAPDRVHHDVAAGRTALQPASVTAGASGGRSAGGKRETGRVTDLALRLFLLSFSLALLLGMSGCMLALAHVRSAERDR